MPLFSIIIPVYNRGALIAQTLDSVLLQDFRDYEIICVDDGSTDDSVAIIESYANRGVKLIRQSNLGPGAARNAAARHANGDYLALLDSDDIWFPWTLQRYADAIQSTRRPAVLSGRLFYFQRDEELSHIRPAAAAWDVYPDYLASSRDGLYCGSCQAVIQRDVFEQAGGFTSQRINAEDHDFIFRIGTERGFVYVREPAMIGYRQHAGAVTHNLAKTINGIRYLVEQELAGRYPGGKARQADRRRILAQHVRPVTLAALKHGDRHSAWSLFRQTLMWQLRSGRFRYVAGFAAIAAAACFRRAS